MINKQKLVSWYSALASSYLIIHGGLKANVIYTDISPDTMLDSATEFTELDIDDNGIIDFAFLNTDFTAYDYPYGDVHFQRILASPFAGNKIAGTSQSTAFSSYYFYPFALSNGSLINEDLTFQDFFYQGLATRKYTFLFPSLGTGIETGGNWYPESLDHFLGIKFVDATGHSHYGWIRCDVIDEGRTLIIKDFAYEKKSNEGIIAGDTIGDTTFDKSTTPYLDSVIHVGIKPDISNLGNVYGFDDQIYIQLISNSKNYKCCIYNLYGQLVLEKVLHDTQIIISMEGQPIGYYIIELFIEGKRYYKNIYIY